MTERTQLVEEEVSDDVLLLRIVEDGRIPSGSGSSTGPSRGMRRAS
ncbi:hypothetical protein ACF1AO_32835 [Streptomyces longwoodensis]